MAAIPGVGVWGCMLSLNKVVRRKRLELHNYYIQWSFYLTDLDATDFKCKNSPLYMQMT